MLKYPPWCFSCASTTSIPAVPAKSTSFYDTHLGIASLTWSRSLLGLSVVADLQLFASPATENETKGPFGEFDYRQPNSRKTAAKLDSQKAQPRHPESTSDNLHFRIFLPLPFKRKGSKTLNLKTSSGRLRRVNLVWDLSHATFSRQFGPEPLAGFFFAIAVDGETLLLAGDRPNEASRRIKSARPKSGKIATEPISKTIEVKLGEIKRNTSWISTARFAGREREILFSFDLEKKRMRLAINGERVLHVRRLRWNFRGSEIVEMEGGDRVHVSWDLFRFLFESDGDAVIVLGFENGEDGHFRKREGFSGKSGDWSEDSSRSWTTATSSQSVEDWDSFTLVICARKG